MSTFPLLQKLPHCLMSIPNSILHDFIVTVPSCFETTRLAVVLEIFSQGQCDLLVVVSEQQCPIGVVYPARLMPYLISSHGYKGNLDVQQPLSAVSLIVEPIVALPAALSVEQFGFYLHSQYFQTDTGPDWALVDSDGKFLGLLNSPHLCLTLAQDMTEQQLALELIAKNTDLIGLNRLKDEFLACISHELKTPLTVIIGLSTLLEDQALGQLNERQTHYAQLIHQSGRHLMTTVNHILDLTRLETGQLKLTPESVQIESVCLRAINQARLTPISPAKHACDHRFTLFIEPGLDSLVADELRLSQMLVHLLSNAFKFTEVGGEVGLRVNRWEGWIAFTVWDTGIGIPEQKQHLIFQKFQQLENPLTRQFQGTGLGLVLTRALVRLHGGDITFLSKEGKGSEFTLLLPPSTQNGEEPGSWGSLTIQENHFNRLVLVVEASPQFIEDSMELLSGLGYRIVIARSGTEALEKARRLQPQAIFLNPLLPLLSGWDVLTLLKSDTATHQIPAIVTATLAEKERAFSNRADDFLSLPVQQQILQKVLARCATSVGHQPSA